LNSQVLTVLKICFWYRSWKWKHLWTIYRSGSEFLTKLNFY